MVNEVLVYYTHRTDESVKRELKRLSSELPSPFEIWATGCCATADGLDELRSDRVKTQTYVRDDLRRLPYEAKLATVNWVTMRENSDLVPLLFFIDHPNFDRYWFVEYDVRYSGNWGELISNLSHSPADLLCTHLSPFGVGSEWMHWKNFHTGNDEVSNISKWRGFLPFCRVSFRLMEAIDGRCRDGWCGHPEAIWPTVANINNFLVEEIGGNSTSVPEQRKGLYYFSARPPGGPWLSTFQAWPNYSETSNFYTQSPPNVLWHPVKA